jgi:hypothetical protein
MSLLSLGKSKNWKRTLRYSLLGFPFQLQFKFIWFTSKSAVGISFLIVYVTICIFQEQKKRRKKQIVSPDLLSHWICTILHVNGFYRCENVKMGNRCFRPVLMGQGTSQGGEMVDVKLRSNDPPWARTNWEIIAE